MKEEHFVGKVAQKAVIERGNEVLITRDSRDRLWELPGGRMNMGELPSEGLIRELREELGVAVSVHEVISVEQYFHSHDQKFALMIGYRATLADELAVLSVDPQEVAEWRFVTREDLAEIPMYQDCQNILTTYFQTKKNVSQ